ncbi:MAG: hypothetical protein A2X77_00020 [Gammaproteobacteria bacterium GWE2_42_36]|nr:MAG: hypothetical protein A2X77_00020 [Gammaproteobacteria bacterium GWE2_42_36]
MAIDYRRGGLLVRRAPTSSCDSDGEAGGDPETIEHGEARERPEAEENNVLEEAEVSIPGICEVPSPGNEDGIVSNSNLV